MAVAHLIPQGQDFLGDPIASQATSLRSLFGKPLDKTLTNGRLL